ncbi:MAG: amino acid adenylation domain-containing protein, partial [Bacteroidetes bacterium]|nr:amino acid adenylation domain-containing protein [Fibrella sp.]
ADGARMCVFRQRPIDLTYDDVSLRSETEKEQFVADYVRQDALYVFNLTAGPLLKAGLIKLADDVYHLTLTAHHIICDGWSVAVMLQDLGKLYSAYARNMFPDLPAAALFSRFADEQFLFTKSADYQRLEQFWVEQYRAGIPVVNLPTDGPRPALRTFTSERLDYTLDPDLVLALKKMGAQAGCSFVTTLLAAFEVFIHRLTGQDALIIGLPAAGQSATGAYRLVGHCVNLLPLRSHPTGDLSFAAYLKQRKGELFDAYEHQRLTFGSLLRKLNVARDASRVPLVPVVFNIDTGMDDGVEFHGLHHQLIGNPKAYDNFELFLNATSSNEGLTLEWSYNTQLFRAETIRRMTVGFNELLQALVGDPGSTLAALPVDASRIFERAPVNKNGKKISPAVTESKPPVGADGEALTTAATVDQEFIDQLFEAVVGENSQRTAVSIRDQTLSYEQLNSRADQLSRAILHHAPHDEIIGVSATRSLAMVISMVAILKAGKAYLPLDPAYPAQRLQQIITDSGIGTCLASAPDAGLFQSLGLVTITPENERNYWDQSVIRRQANACVLYTSGSTGKPKGVCLGHTGLINLVRWQQAHTTARQGVHTLQFCHLSFDASFQEIFVPLLTGGTVHLVDDNLRLNATALLEFISEQSINRLFLPYVALQYLAEAADVQNSFPATLTEVTTGGDLLKITPQIVRFFDALPHCTLMNVYGPTEASIWVTELKLKGDALNWPKIPTIGRPIAGLDVFIVDEAMQLVVDGDIGELCISGVCLATGYLNDPAQTAERFISWNHPQRGAIRMYKTGDLARYLASGDIEFHGRKDNQVKIRGNRVELGEIEVALNQEETVQQAVVIVREQAPGQKRLVAYLVPTSEEVDTLPIKQRLERQLPDYMIPSAFVWLGELPQTTSGKVDRLALPEPDVLRPNMSVAYRAPATPTEERLVGLWEEALKLDEIGVDDNFFELGGHSLVAVQFMMHLERETGKRLPLSTLFEYSTIHKLAALLTTEAQPGTLKSLVPIKPTGSKIPVYVIHGDGLNVLNFSGLAAHMDADQPVYGLQARGLDG